VASTRKAKRLAAAEAARSGSSTRTHLLGVLAGGAVITVFGAEVARVWKLGTLPRSRQITSEEDRRAKPIEAVITLKEGYAVSRTRENALFNMLASFTVAFGITRAITWTIREHGGFGPIKDVTVGDRHIHHFLPGGILALTAGGVAIGTKGEKLDKYLAFPFGVGVALVLDETALLLELDDVYWTEEGVLSVQIAFAAIAMLSALAYLIRMLRHGEAQDSETDWELAAKAWDDLQMSSGGVPGIGLSKKRNSRWRKRSAQRTSGSRLDRSSGRRTARRPSSGRTG
jgi:hypothetical protein